VQLFDRDRSGDAVRALRDMAALPQSGWDDLSAAAVETVAKHFGVDRMLEQTASLYRGVLGTARNRWRPGRARSA
jgi:hypothetical protein